MANYDQIGLAPSANPRTDQVYVVRGRADFKKNPCVTGDTIAVAKVPAGTLMLYGATMVTRTEGAASTIDVGTTTTTNNEIDDNVDSNAAGGTYGTADTCKFEGDGFLEALVDTTIYVTAVTAAMDNAIIDVILLCAATSEDILGS